MPIAVKSANTILYCGKWEETVRFYRDRLELPVTFSSDWFVEFRSGDGAFISIADEKRSSVKTCRGQGVTITLEVDDIEAAHRAAGEIGLNPTDIRTHPWGARVFYLRDPEGHRLEIWRQEASATAEAPAGSPGY